MKRIVYCCILITGLILLSGCKPATAPEPTSLPPATQEIPPTAIPATAEPTPEPTEEPIIPCNIVFESDRDGNQEIYSMKADGSEQVNLTNNPAGDTNPVWSPDGSQILFISDRGEGCEEGGRCMFIMNADGSKVSRVSQQNDCSTPDW